MAISKVVFNNKTILDLSNVTIDSTDVEDGTSTHGADGTIIVGTMSTDHSKENAIINRSLSGSYENNRITKVAKKRFEKATNLTAINFPKVTEVNEYAFGLCTALTSVSLPSAEIIYGHAFRKDTALTTVDIPTVSSIYTYAFQYCHALSSINFDNYQANTTRVSSYAFSGCYVLPEKVFSKCTVIESYGFANCRAFTSVDTNYYPMLQNPVNGAFQGCNNITTVNLPNSVLNYDSTVKQYMSNSFSGCTALTSVYVPKGRFQYTSSTFANCTNLPYLILPSNDQAGASFAAGCSSIIGIDMMHYNSGNTAGSQTGIGATAFQNDSNFNTFIIRYPWTVTSLININAFSGTPFASGGSGGIVYVPKRLVSKFEAASNWSTLVAGGSLTFAPIEGSIYETHWVNGDPCNWFTYEWDVSKGLLSEDGWTKTITGDALEILSAEGCVLTSNGSGASVRLRRTAFNESGMIVVEVYVTGYNSDETSSNFIIDLTNGTKGFRISLKNGYWYCNSTQLCEAVSNTSYKIEAGIQGSAHNALAVFINDVQYLHKAGGLSTSYTNMQILSSNQAGYSSVIKSIKYRPMIF